MRTSDFGGGLRGSREKPYFYLPFDGRVDAVGGDKLVGHHSFSKGKLVGKLELRIKVVSECLFVGSGLKGLEKNERGEVLVCQTFARRGEHLILPGTSIKGAIRSIFEAITPSCISVYEPEEPPSTPKCSGDNLCPACRLFGSLGYMGRLSFEDALPERYTADVRKVGSLFGPGKPQNDDSDYRKFYRSGVPGPEEKGRHTYVQVVLKDSSFKTKVWLNNVEPHELDLLLLSMGLDLHGQRGLYNRFAPKLGGFKPRCFGSVLFEPVGLSLLDVNTFQQSSLEGDEMRKHLRQILEGAIKRRQSYLKVENLKRLAENMQVGATDFLCPSGPY